MTAFTTTCVQWPFIASIAAATAVAQASVLHGAARVERDPQQRRVAERHYHLPIHRQALSRAARRQVHSVVTANDMVRVVWMRID